MRSKSPKTVRDLSIVVTTTLTSQTSSERFKGSFVDLLSTNFETNDVMMQDLMNQQHATPQIRTPRSSQSRVRSDDQKNYSSSPEDDRHQATIEQNERNLKRKLIRSESAIAEVAHLIFTDIVKCFCGSLALFAA